jgi:hypothetical protein
MLNADKISLRKTVLDETKKCNELIKKIETIVYEICHCDNSLVDTDYDKLLLQKKKCQFCRHKIMSNFLLEHHIGCYDFIIDDDNLMEKLLDLELNGMKKNKVVNLKW